MLCTCDHGDEFPRSIREWYITKEAHWLQLFALQEGIYCVL